MLARFFFDRIIIKVAGNQDMHKSSVEFDFGPNQTTHFGVTCPWVKKKSHFWTWISLKPVSQSWSNFMCSIIGLGERLQKVLGQIDFGTLDSGEWLLPFGQLVLMNNHEHGVRHSANETASNIWQFGNDIVHIEKKIWSPFLLRKKESLRRKRSSNLDIGWF